PYSTVTTVRIDANNRVLADCGRIKFAAHQNQIMQVETAWQKLRAHRHERPPLTIGPGRRQINYLIWITCAGHVHQAPAAVDGNAGRMRHRKERYFRSGLPG